MMKSLILYYATFSLFALTTLSIYSQSPAKEIAKSDVAYDLVIKNGRVMDPETMLDATLNVGVKDGRIYKNTIN